MSSLLLASVADAQEISARDRQSAGEAYDRGTAAYLAEDFARAAQWFETAHRLAPAAAALVQATRSHQRAGNAQRAASLGLRLRELYPDDRAAQRTAARVLRGSERYLRVDVRCEECTVEVDGSIMGHSSFFVSPDEEHQVVASFPTGNVSQTVNGGAGETRELSLDAPEPEPEPDPEPDVTPEPDPLLEDPETAQSDDGGGGGVPLAVTIGAMGVTAALGAVLIWSGVDTLDGVPAYEADPTPEGLADGQSREERTNWLIAGTAVAGAATLVLAILTDWGDGDDSSEESEADRVQATFGVQEDGGMVGLRGSF